MPRAYKIPARKSSSFGRPLYRPAPWPIGSNVQRLDEISQETTPVLTGSCRGRPVELALAWKLLLTLRRG